MQACLKVVLLGGTLDFVLSRSLVQPSSHQDLLRIACCAACIRCSQEAYKPEMRESSKKGEQSDPEPVHPGGNTGVADGQKKGKKAPAADQEEEDTYYDAMKREMAARATRTQSALQALAPHQRIAMEGFRPGTYLRLRFTGKHIICVDVVALKADDMKEAHIYIAAPFPCQVQSYVP